MEVLGLLEENIIHLGKALKKLAIAGKIHSHNLVVVDQECLINLQHKQQICLVALRLQDKQQILLIVRNLQEKQQILLIARNLRDKQQIILVALTITFLEVKAIRIATISSEVIINNHSLLKCLDSRLLHLIR